MRLEALLLYLSTIHPILVGMEAERVLDGAKIMLGRPVIRHRVL
jgi:hypothetical protein